MSAPDAAAAGHGRVRVASSRLTSVVYALPAIPLAGLGLPLAVYLPTFFATAMKLDVGRIGMVFLLVRLLDIGFDPLMGLVMDGTSTRMGRFRPWLLAGGIVLGIGIWKLFEPPPSGGLIYLATWLLVSYLGFSICYIGHLALGAVIAQRDAWRSDVFVWWQIGNLAGLTAVMAIPLVIGHGAAPDLPQIVHAMGWFLLVGLAVSIPCLLLVVDEPRQPRGTTSTGLRLLVALMGYADVRRLLLADLLFGLATGLNGALFVFYFTVVKGVTFAWTVDLIFVNMAGALCGTPLWGYAAGRLGRRRAAKLAFAGYAASLVAIALTPSRGAGGIALLFAAGLTLAAGQFLIRAMMAETGEELLIATGFDRTGALSSLFSSTNKLGLALAPGLGFLALEHAGFHPSAGAGGTGGITALAMFYIWIPVLLGLAAAAALRGYRLGNPPGIET